MKPIHVLGVSVLCGAVVLASPASVSASPGQDPPAAPVRVSPYIAPADVGAPPADAEVTPSGLATKVIQKGEATATVHPRINDVVTVNYTGWTTDRKLVDSSYRRNQPAIVQLEKMMPGWIEGVQLMVVGEKRRMWIPEKLAYKGLSGKPAGTLVFDIELLEISVIPSAPADVSRPPADAERNRSGIRSMVIRPGTGTAHPKGSSTVTVHYTGWTTDGKMFDSSYTRGQPLTAALEDMVPGWREGVPLMVAGEKRRFWIPEDMAYKGQNGKPVGMLVFDIDLISYK